MSTEVNKAALHQFRAALDAGDFDSAIAVFAPHAVVHVSGSPEPLTVEGFKQMGRLMLTAFSEGRTTVEDVIAEGSKVVSRITFRATHTGDLMGIPATGRPVTIAEVIVDHFVDGNAVESWRMFDQMGLMQQIGAIPVQGQGDA